MATSYNSKIVTDGLVLCLDAANPKSYSPNVHPYPTDIYSWVNTSVGYQCTLSRDTIQSPVGTKSLKMVITGTDPYTPTYNNSLWNIVAAVAGQTWTVSVWVKASITTTMEGPYIFGANSSGTYLEASSTAFTVTTSWTRISYTYTLVNASTTNLQVRLDGTQTGGTGVTIWWDGLQVERSSSMTTFNSKTNYNNTNWFDQSGNAINGTLVGSPTYSSANNGNLVFDGTNNWVSNISLSTLSGGSSPLTMEIAHNAGTYPGSWRSIMDIEDSVSSKNISLRRADVNTFTADYYDGTTDIQITYTGSAGIWRIATIVFDGTNMVFYMDGVLVGSSAISLSLTTPPTVHIARAYSDDRPTNVTLSNIKVYNKALTADQVLQNFNATRGRYGI